MDYTPSTTGGVGGSVNGTTGNVTGANLANDLTTVSIAGSKTWNDDSNKYGMRPANIALTVLADGTPLVSQPTVNWTKTGDVWDLLDHRPAPLPEGERPRTSITRSLKRRRGAILR